MKVKVLASFLLKGEHQQEGSIIDVSENESRSLIALGYIEPAKDDQSQIKEK